MFSLQMEINTSFTPQTKAKGEYLGLFQIVLLGSTRVETIWFSFKSNKWTFKIVTMSLIVFVVNIFTHILL